MYRANIRRFEQWCRDHGVPYVAVDEAPRVRPQHHRRPFHFVIYPRDAGPNLLVLVRPVAQRNPTVADCQLMAEWQGAFSANAPDSVEWQAAFIDASTLPPTAKGLDGEPIDLAAFS